MEALYGPKRARRRRPRSASTTMEQGARRRRRPNGAGHAASPDATDDPDGGSSGIVYDKGAIFLRTIEAIVGRERWDAYLRSYFDRHAFQPMTSAPFLADLRANLVNGDAALEDKAAARPLGLSARRARQCGAARSGSLRRRSTRRSPPSTPAARRATGRSASWNTAERLRFLNKPAAQRCRQRGSTELDQALRTSTKPAMQKCCSPGSIWRFANRYEPAVPVAERFLTAQGRRKFVQPLFETLLRQGRIGAGRSPCASTRRDGASYHHPITRARSSTKLKSPFES